MPGLFLVNAIDAGRALGPRLEDATPAQVEHFFRSDYLLRKGGSFNHDTSIFATGDLFRGRITIPQAETFCLSNGSAAGREQNAAIIRVVGPYAVGRLSVVHKVGYIAIPVGRALGHTIYIGVKAPYVRVNDSEARLVIPGYRKTFIPSDEQIIFPCSLASNQIARDDFAGVLPEYLYAGPGDDGEDRKFKAVIGSPGSVLQRDQLDDLLNVYVKGIVRILEAGEGLKPARLAGYRIIDPSQYRGL